jgi:hypothetical protein
MKITIDIPEQDAAALEAKAAADGLTLVEWLERLAAQQSLLTLRPFKSSRGILKDLGPAPSAEEIDENRREMFRNFARDID